MKDETKKEDTFSLEQGEIQGVEIRAKLAAHEDGSSCLGCSTVSFNFHTDSGVFCFELSAGMAAMLYERMGEAFAQLHEAHEKNPGKGA